MTKRTIQPEPATPSAKIAEETVELAETPERDPLSAQFWAAPTERAERARARAAELQAQIAESLDRSTVRAQRLVELEAALDAQVASRDSLASEIGDLDDAMPAQIRAAEALLIADARTPGEGAARARVGELKERLRVKARAHAEAAKKVTLLAEATASERARLLQEDAAEEQLRTQHASTIAELEKVITASIREAGEMRFNQLLGEVRTLEWSARERRAQAEEVKRGSALAREAMIQILEEEGHPGWAQRAREQFNPAPSAQAATIEILEAAATFLEACGRHAGQVPQLIAGRYGWSRLFDWSGRFSGSLAGVGDGFSQAQRDINYCLEQLRNLEQQEMAQRAAVSAAQ
jgi:hypothetical protein